MNTSEQHAGEGWSVCAPGTLERLGRRIRGRRRRQILARLGAPAALIVFLSLVVWHVHQPDASRGLRYGGVTCRQVEAHMRQYVMGRLPSDLQRAIAEHLAHCPYCREKMKSMQRGTMPVSAMPAAVGLRSALARTEVIHKSNFSERLTLHRSPAASELN